MTRNQIEYLKYKESQRANMRQEELTASRDATARELGFGNLSETVRHNQQTERHNVAVLGEQQRHNYAQEYHNSQVLGEQIRSNRANEELQSRRDAEVARANRARESETTRHNAELESQGRINLSLQEQSVQETKRSNLSREYETSRANRARESETERANRAAESNRAQILQLNYAQLAELSRHNKATESLGYSQLAEQSRSNKSNERIRLGELTERQRANIANEALIKARDKMNFEEQVRSNLAREEETSRHNKTQEEISAYEADIRDRALTETITHNEVMERQGAIRTSADAISKGARLLPLILG